MPQYEFRSPRLFVASPMAAGARLPLAAAQTHYLADVLRLKPASAVLVFNGRDGEWLARFEPEGRRTAYLTLEHQARPQPASADLHYLFAPLKRARLDYMVQKAVEMGATRLVPVMTRFTQAERVNTDRLRANAIEAAEQCGILVLPEIADPVPLTAAIAALEGDRLLVFCDESAEVADPIAALAARRAAAPLPIAVLIGPEGGFAEEERALLLARSPGVRLALGPRILRADTAAVAALAVVQAALGDWR
ncbi:16S rRNA (uracil(1498)-N(3))-methyltransferase [Xanthobacteraceae bacterium Astr-EGSB]|uniref:16S rRNA (uracil(1498)-N(3))-methyltransferase n=1 Tax=Astrobacterium formosum TaxID=3069710 RepID=UPI0027AF5BD4|nr:16S rRNA (uracil(1498)-N(3))-methyltransferase [Xanthobacteraceae bacterium Astr-EGSB]